MILGWLGEIQESDSPLKGSRSLPGEGLARRPSHPPVGRVGARGNRIMDYLLE